MKSASPSTGIALAFVCLCILGTMPVIADSRPGGFDALAFAFFLSVWQVVFAAPVLLHERRRGRAGLFSAHLAPRQRRRGLIVALSTGAMFGASTYFYVLGVEMAGAVNAAIAIQAYPVFAILVEAVLLKRRKTPLELALTAVLVGSLVYLGTGGSWRLEGASVWLLVPLGVPFLWSIAHVLIRRELIETPVTPAQVTVLRVAISTVFLGIVLVVAQPGGLAALLAPEFQMWAMLMGLVYTTELIVWFHAMRAIDVSLASAIVTPWPALTMVLAAVVLGEPVRTYQMVAFALVVMSIYGLTVAGLRGAKTAAAQS